MNLILIAIVVVVFLVFLWVISKARRRPSAEELINQSAGIWDEPAIAADDLLTKTGAATTTAVGAATRGRLRALGRDQGETVRPDVVDDFNRAIMLAAERPTEDNLIIADMIEPIVLGPWDEGEINDPWENLRWDLMPDVIHGGLNARRTARAAQATTREEFTTGMLADAAEIRSDSQNVHDTAVQNDMRGRWLAINSGRKATDDELRSYFGITNPGRFSTHVYKIGADTGDILRVVAARAIDQSGGDRGAPLVAAVQDALREIQQPDGNMLCPVGVATHLMGSLVLIDSDPRVSAPVVTEAIRRKEVLDAVGAAVLRETEAAIGDKSNPLHAAALVYTGVTPPGGAPPGISPGTPPGGTSPGTPLSDESTAAAPSDAPFIEHLRNVVNEIVDRAELPQDTADRLRAECGAAL